jgi:hypothetical protein
MNNRLSRILTRWFKTHPVYGIAPMCAAIVMDAGDEAALLIPPDTGVRLPVTVYNDVDDDCLVPKFNPDVVPALCIIPQMSTLSPMKRGRGQVDYEGVQVGVSYIERDQKETLARKRGGYVMEAVLESMIAFQKPEHSAIPRPGDVDGYSWRRLGPVEIVDVTAIEEYRVTLGIGASAMFGAIIPTFRIRKYVNP